MYSRLSTEVILPLSMILPSSSGSSRRRKHKRRMKQSKKQFGSFSACYNGFSAGRMRPDGMESEELNRR